MNTYAGIDLHSSNNYLVVIDDNDKRLFEERLPNDLEAVCSALEPFRDTLSGVVVESTYNWYWLVDGLQEQGYIYPKKMRAVRDLLRRRLLFVQQRTTQILSLQSMITRNLGGRMSGNEIKKLKVEDADELFDSPFLVFTAQKNIETILFLKGIIRDIEKEVLAVAKLNKEFQIVKTIPGIGNILALTIMLEVGDIGRFADVGNYSSYCRCVASKDHK